MQPDDDSTPVLPITRFTLLLGLMLSSVAGVQLYLFPTRTAEFFAWTIGVPLSAAFLGAGYWSTLPSLALALGIRDWLAVRILVAGVLVFCGFIALATLQHLGLFHLFTGGLVARGAAWIWLAVYFGLPWLLVACLVLQEHADASKQHRIRQPVPAWGRIFFLVAAVALACLGLALTIAPMISARSWPWTLTPLTGRAIGAWCLLLATVSAWALYERDWLRVRSIIPFSLTFYALQLFTAFRFRTALADRWPTWTYLGVLVFLLLVTAVLTAQQETAAQRASFTRSPDAAGGPAPGKFHPPQSTGG